jgi:hypothetical protein
LGLTFPGSFIRLIGKPSRVSGFVQIALLLLESKKMI